MGLGWIWGRDGLKMVEYDGFLPFGECRLWVVQRASGILVLYDDHLFSNLLETSVELFMNDFVPEKFIVDCLRNPKAVLSRCEETNLALNGEKFHFVVEEGIVLWDKIFKNNELKVDKAKIKVSKSCLQLMSMTSEVFWACWFLPVVYKEFLLHFKALMWIVGAREVCVYLSRGVWNIEDNFNHCPNSHYAKLGDVFCVDVRK